MDLCSCVSLFCAVVTGVWHHAQAQLVSISKYKAFKIELAVCLNVV